MIAFELTVYLIVLAALGWFAGWLALSCYRYYRDNKPRRRGATYVNARPKPDSRSSIEYSKPHMPSGKRYS
jgi:hypothetical protein